MFSASKNRNETILNAHLSRIGAFTIHAFIVRKKDNFPYYVTPCMGISSCHAGPRVDAIAKD